MKLTRRVWVLAAAMLVAAAAAFYFALLDARPSSLQVTQSTIQALSTLIRDADTQLKTDVPMTELLDGSETTRRLRESKLVDAWGHSLQFAMNSRGNSCEYVITSNGPDGIVNTHDDVVFLKVIHRACE